MARLRGALGSLAAVSDQPCRPAHPGPPGAVVLSAVGYIGVHGWQVDDVPIHDRAVARSYARDASALDRDGFNRNRQVRLNGYKGQTRRV